MRVDETGRDNGVTKVELLRRGQLRNLLVEADDFSRKHSHHGGALPLTVEGYDLFCVNQQIQHG